MESMKSQLLLWEDDNKDTIPTSLAAYNIAMKTRNMHKSCENKATSMENVQDQREERL